MNITIFVRIWFIFSIDLHCLKDCCGFGKWSVKCWVS